MPAPYEADWRHRVAASPFRAVVSFDGENLVLGSGTVLTKLGSAASGTISLRPDAAHDRMAALLAVAGRGRVAKAALAQLAAALDDWRRGNRGLAAIRLAFAALPRLRDSEEAYSLFLAETALDAGLSPNDLLKALGYSACTPLLKFDPNQPRVPAGSGPRSGQWTSGGAAGATTAPTRGPASSRPAPTPPKPDSAESIGPISVFFRPEPDGEDEVSQDKERRFGTGETEEDRIHEGRPFRFPAPGGIGPSTPGFPDFSALRRRTRAQSRSRARRRLPETVAACRRLLTRHLTTRIPMAKAYRVRRKTTTSRTDAISTATRMNMR